MNGSEVRKRVKEVFEDSGSTQHQKLDALYLLILNNSDAIGKYAWIYIPERWRKPVKVVVGTWAGLVSLASIERIYSFLQSIF